MKIEEGWRTQKQVCAEALVSAKTFRKWNCPVIHTHGPAKYYALPDLLASYHAYHSAQQSGAAAFGATAVDGTGSEEFSLDLPQEQAKKIRADRQGREIKNAELMRELAPVEMLGHALDGVVGSLAAILSSIPLNIKRRHPEVSNVVIREVEREIVKARNQMSSVGLEFGAIEPEL